MNNFIKRKNLTTPFLTVDEIVQKETVYSQAFMEDPLFKKNFYEWFEFYDKNRNNMHIYQVNVEWANKIGDMLGLLSVKLKSHLGHLFDEHTDEEMLTLFPMPNVPKQDALNFVAYARHTYEDGHVNIGARYDFGIAEDGSIFIYEINADTQSMLFESMNLQNLMAEHLGDTDAQFNEIWNMVEDRPFMVPGTHMAIIAHDKSNEDFGTTESIAQLAERSGGLVTLSMIDDLQYDPNPADANRNPFFLKSCPDADFKYIYVMLPWEEMVLSNPKAFEQWRSWTHTVDFFEPAWAWFISHKAFLADFCDNKEYALHELGKPDPSPSLYVHSSTVPLGPEQVVKPAIGRKSSGIEIQQNGQSVKSSDQTYAGGPVVYQPYRPTIKIDGVRVMGCMWMYGRQSACLAFREFDGDILELDNERVIMHELVGS